MKDLTKKDVALNIMKRLDIYKPYIEGFDKEDRVCFFENFGGFWVFQEPEVEAFLIVPNYPEEWDDLIYSENRNHTVFAYVWNKTDEWCSEFGDIIVQSFGGGIRRIA